jgi:hypothetical protein
MARTPSPTPPRPSTPSPTPPRPSWTLDKNGVKPSVPLTKAEQDHLNEFMNKVREDTDPKTAASGWDSNYKHLQGDQYQIRLSQSNRATFTVDTTHHVVKMLAVGGHT